MLCKIVAPENDGAFLPSTGRPLSGAVIRLENPRAVGYADAGQRSITSIVVNQSLQFPPEWVGIR